MVTCSLFFNSFIIYPLSFEKDNNDDNCGNYLRPRKLKFHGFSLD